jgi:hypothetical protein
VIDYFLSRVSLDIALSYVNLKAPKKMNIRSYRSGRAPNNRRLLVTTELCTPDHSEWREELA